MCDDRHELLLSSQSAFTSAASLTRVLTFMVDSVRWRPTGGHPHRPHTTRTPAVRRRAGPRETQSPDPRHGGAESRWPSARGISVGIRWLGRRVWTLSAERPAHVTDVCCRSFHAHQWCGIRRYDLVLARCGRVGGRGCPIAFAGALQACADRGSDRAR